MANLLNKNIGTNYKGILNLNTLNGNLSGTLQAVTDGDGNASALELSTSLSRISANLTIGGSTTASARLHVRGDGITSGTTALLVQNSAINTSLQVNDEQTITGFSGSQLRFRLGYTPSGQSISTRDGQFAVGLIDANQNSALRFLTLGTGASYIDGYSEGTTKTTNYKIVFGSRINNTGIAIINSTGAENGSPCIFGFDVHDASAIVQINSTTRGFLPPRMTTTQVNAIATPAEGLVVFNTTISHLCVYQSGAWVRMSHSPM